VLAVPRHPRALLAVLAAAAVLLTGCLIDAGDSKAARGMELALQDDAVFANGQYKRVSGAKAYSLTRALGVTRQRVNIQWAYTMPEVQFNARRKPAAVNYNFAGYDALIDQAAANGVRLHVSLTGPAPRWANPRHYVPKRGWYKPSASEFGKFATLAAEHFKGRVDRYSIWNEPNWKTWLGPLASGPALYRQLYIAGYKAIKAADPAAKVLIGETAPFSKRGFSTSPLAFLRGVTCVNKKYKRARSCPKLKADGYAHHPYDFGHAPNYQYPGADNVTIGTLSRLTKALDKLSRAGVLRKNGGGKMPLYLTEYGYFASGHRALPKKLRTRYLKQAYSIALKNSRVKSQLQYLLVSPPRSARASFFDLGLVSTRGTKNVGYKALQSWYRSNRGKVKRPGAAITLPPAPPNPVG
jgi:Glycosyl hydrolase family 1